MNFKKLLAFSLVKFLILSLPILGIYSEAGNSLSVLILPILFGMYLISNKEIKLLRSKLVPLITFIIGSFFLIFYPILWEPGEGHPPIMPPLIFFIPFYLILCFIPVIASIIINRKTC